VKVLVTGGTGVVGTATVSELLRRGHEVRLFSRHAEEQQEAWCGKIEAWNGDVTRPDTIHGAADGCDAVLHITGIVKEGEPPITFEEVNVKGTARLVEEAARAGVSRFICISSLGAERGSSEYHASKRSAEAHVREFPGQYHIVRLGNVYGPGDSVLSLLLRMVRVLPAVPVIDRGNDTFQPIWHRDAAAALARLVEGEIEDEVVSLAGPEQTTINEVLDEFARITDRSPPRIPLPSSIADLGLRAATALGVDLPLSTASVRMLTEGSLIPPGTRNLLDRLQIKGTPIREGLEQLTSALPEVTPEQGVGPLKYHGFSAEIKEPHVTAEHLFEMFRLNFGDFVPIEAQAEPGSPRVLELGTTLTLKLPLRGNIQVRVEKVADGEITLATIAGHTFAGFVHFAFHQRDGGIRIEIDTYVRPSTRVDQAAMLLGGELLQAHTWRETAQRIIDASGGRAPDGITQVGENLDDMQAVHIERWARRTVMKRKRRQENA